MIKGLSEKEKFNLIKPLPKNWKKDEKGIPYLKKNEFNNVDWNKINFASYSNLKSIKKPKQTVLFNFQYDKSIIRIYNDIFKFSLRTINLLAVATPDYSAYMNMEPCMIEENVRHSLWVGAWLQYLGINIIPTITWADKRTYDICFNYIAKGSIVAISTIGALNNYNAFIEGFNEMMKRIEPSLIIVRGKMIKGMQGNFIFIDFADTFNVAKKYEQLNLFKLNKIQKIEKEKI